MMKRLTDRRRVLLAAVPAAAAVVAGAAAAQVAHEVIDSFSGVAKERGVSVKLIAPGAPVRVVGERFQLAQVVHATYPLGFGFGFAQRR